MTSARLIFFNPLQMFERSLEVDKGAGWLDRGEKYKYGNKFPRLYR